MMPAWPHQGSLLKKMELQNQRPPAWLQSPKMDLVIRFLLLRKSQMFHLLPCLSQTLPVACCRSLPDFGGSRVSLHRMELTTAPDRLQSFQSGLSQRLGGRMLSPLVVVVNLDLVLTHLVLLVVAFYLCLE